MKLATIRLDDRTTTAVRVEGDALVDLGLPDVGAVLASVGGLDAAGTAGGQRYAGADAEFAPLVPRPTKVVCVGLNYQKHIKEMGRDLPEYPT
ncbi:fumarylacetoacetate hydrolase family protein, partial [Streptomyces sp. NPDC002920]